MSQGNGRQVDARFDAYVDGTLDAAERAEFEHRLTTDAGLRSELDRQRVVNDSLRRLFPLPGADRAAAILRAAKERGSATDGIVLDARLPAPAFRPIWLRRIPVYGWAAAIVVLAVAGWWAKTALFPPHELGRTQFFQAIEPLEAVRRIERENHEPDIVCKDDQQFAALAWMKTDQGLMLRQPLPEGVEVVGWSQQKTVLSDKTLVLMTKVQGLWVYVIVDAKVNDRPLTLPADSKFKLFRSEVGNIVLYEMTPHERPKLLDQFYDPKKPVDWYREGVRW